MLKDRVRPVKKERSRTIPKVLLYVAQNPSRSKWEIAKDLGKSYGNVHATVQDLLAYRLVRVQETKTSANKMKIEYYSITLQGLMSILSRKEGMEAIDKIAETQKDILPLIFGKWPFYQQNGYKELIIERLGKYAAEETNTYFAIAQPQPKTQDPNLDDVQEMLLLFAKIQQKEGVHLPPALTQETIRTQIATLKKAHRLIHESADSIFVDSVTRNVLLYPTKLLDQKEVKTQQNFLSALRKDKDLASFVRSAYKKLQSRYEFDLKNIRSFLKEWDHGHD